MDVGARANEQEDDEQQALEIEQRRLGQTVSKAAETSQGLVHTILLGRRDSRCSRAGRR